ncbi:MAG: hypothetical protein RR101_02335 [Burkholderiaceae bacterium]
MNLKPRREADGGRDSRRRIAMSRMPAVHRSPLAPVCVLVGGLLCFLVWTLLK